MARTETSTALYPHPFSKAYWRDAANELKSTKMLVITALMVALRIALKPAAIYVGPQMAIQTATLATALGAMLFGPVMAIPAAMISDTIGFMLYPTGDYFLPFMLTEIASTVIYALCLYRAKPTTGRVLLARFLICFFVNIILQQLIFAWQYTYMGNPDKAKNALLGITAVARIFKNLFFFPIESVVITLFLRIMMPITNRAGLTRVGNDKLRFGKKQIVAMVAVMLVGIASAVTYLNWRYTDTSRSADYTDKQCVQANRSVTQLVLERTDAWEDETVVCIVDSAYRPLFGEETDYTVSVYILDEEAFAAGQAADKKYSMDTLWGYSKSGPKGDKYGSLVKVASATFTQSEKTDAVSDFTLTQVE